MSSITDQIRSEADRRLQDALMEAPAVSSIVKATEQKETHTGLRRSLLASALRLSPAIAPQSNQVLQHCREVLEVETEVELFVYASPTYNAACTATEEGRVFVLLASSLLENFDEGELKYVIGHELGHHIYDHHAVPLHVLLKSGGNLPAQLVLKAFSWQRHAELSADRAGMLCCGGLDAPARALFKLSSGLHRAPSEAQIQAFIEQAHELYREDERSSEQQVAHTDWMSSHPFSPVRLRAAQVFAKSDILTPGGMTMQEVEQEVEGLMGLMEASYLEEKSDEAEHMRRLLFAAGALVADAHEGISRKERDALAGLLGEAAVPRRLSAERLRAVVPERVEAVCTHVRRSRRAQLIRDLIVIAQADEALQPAETQVILDMARRIDVPASFVWRNLRPQDALDWNRWSPPAG